MYIQTQLEIMLIIVLAFSLLSVFLLQYAKKTKSRLIESENRYTYYRSLFEQHRNAIIEVGLDGIITGLNPYAERLVRDANVPCIGEPLVKFAFPEYREQVECAFRRAAQGETNVIDPLSIFLSPDHTHWHVTYSPAYRKGKISGVFVTAVNRTDKHNLQLELERRQHNYEQVAESIMDVIFILDSRMVPLYVSPSFEKRLGYERGPYLFTHPVTDYVSEEEAARIRQKRDQLASGEPVANFDLKFPRSDGRIADLECNTTPLLNEEGQLDKLIVVLRDVTLRKSAEQALLEGESLYLKLQHSLDCFSEDAARMMKAAELERRLSGELKKNLRTDRISILETAGFRHFACRQGDTPGEEQLSMLRNYREIRLPVGQVFKLDASAFFVIGNRRGMAQLVWLDKYPAELEKAPVRIWLQTLSRYVDSFYENLLKIKDLTDELESLAQRQRTPAWLLRLMYAVSEKERRGVSQDLHDAALQEQIIWYRKLENLQYADDVGEKAKEEIYRVCEGLLDVIHQIRTTCHELRPPFLKEWGIGQALEALYDQVQLRADYRIRFESSGFTVKLEDEQMIALYRINQELLNNAIKHSEATEVCLSLTDYAGGVLMSYQDNGIGIPESKLQNLLSTMGLYGMKERIRSLEGDMQIDSAPGRGLTVHVHLPRIQAPAMSTAG
ncbi:PAS domain-containing sensor histidine kinase [Saccharibacillus alkalitolerans]|uniref:PAS domain-containing protein n=1 Tax=Saccharibacillus alkalitolerans TaxID=2705290 RepID=A0ABX0F1A1_9BACL|nr:PAS domain-containing protein [Saccharibacillus alkalitolerans]NGZ74751.1 PAS domain-containing protein [Saccharibacillus alkalitolerans]